MTEPSLFVYWDTVAKGLRRKNIFLFLDYDGTLVPIAPRPGEAVLPERTRGLLRQLAALPNCKLAIVSGRSLADVKSMVCLEGIYYAGNHGLEIEGPGILFDGSRFFKSREALGDILRELKTKAAGIDGVLVEDKGMTLSFHYRLAAPEDVRRALDVFKDATEVFRNRGSIRIVAGKKVFEVRPAVDWDKGSVIAWLLDRVVFENKEAALSPVYVGDDATDEDAFRFLKGKGLAVWVGEGRETMAQYRLRDAADVGEFLERLFFLLTEG